MAAVAHVYTHAGAALSSKTVDWVNDDIRAALMGSDYLPDQDGNIGWTDVLSHEIAPVAGAYAAGGYALTGKSITYPATTHNVAHNANAVTIAAPVNAAYVVIYDNTPAGKPLLCYIYFGAVAAITGINWAGAVLTLAAT